MGFLDKVKNMFIEEVEEDEPIKKEVIQVKIPTPIEKKIDDEIEDDVKQPNTSEEIKVEPVKKEEKKPLPTYFDDSDFEDLVEEKKEVIVKPQIKETAYVKKEVPIKPVINGYNGRKEETKKLFTPTPIISPVYGVLDKNYKKDEITSKRKISTPIIHSDLNPINIDDIRNKAYGTLEDEIDTNLISKEDLMFTSVKTNKKNDILEDEEELVEDEKDEITETPIDIFAELENSVNTDIKDEIKEDNIDALDKLLNSYDFSKVDEIEKKDKLTKEIDNNIDTNKDLNDSDLFNLIDAMYEKKDGE